MAEPADRAFLPSALRRCWCPLFPALGNPEALWNHFDHRRRPGARAPCGDSHVSGWRRFASCSGCDATSRFGYKFLKRFCGGGPGRGGNRNRDRNKGKQSDDRVNRERQADLEHCRPGTTARTGNWPDYRRQPNESDVRSFLRSRQDPSDREGLAVQLADSGKIDIAMGGGSGAFLPEAKSGERTDGRDLLLELRGNGFDLVSSRAELEGIPAWKVPKLLGMFSKDDLAFANQLEQWSEQPSLADMVRRGIELLQYNPRGYLLVVDAGLMGKAAEQNDAEKTLTETAELDRAVAVARRYAGARSTVIVCGDVAIGGMSLNGFPFRKDSGLALLGLNSSGQPWITWATGPKGNQSFGTAKTPVEDLEKGNPRAQNSEPAAFYTKSALNVVEDVVAFGAGPGTEVLTGTIDNTQIFGTLRDQL